MQRIIYLAFFYLAASNLQAQQTVAFTEPSVKLIIVTEKTIFYELGETTVPIKIQHYGNRKDIVFINLHDDELTSVDATKRILQEYGGLLIEIENSQERNIGFQLSRHSYKIDPNRIFSKQGIQRSLDQLGMSSDRAIEEAEKFGQRIIGLFPEEVACIIALHNNTPGFFSILEYTRGNKRAADSERVYIDRSQDTDDFFLTTDNILFEKLADKGFNIILQDNKHCTEDGSLSVYCGKRNIRYINCETEHGKTEQYYQMIKALVAALPDNN